MRLVIKTLSNGTTILVRDGVQNETPLRVTRNVETLRAHLRAEGYRLTYICDKTQTQKWELPRCSK